MFFVLFVLCGFAHETAFEIDDSIYILHAGEHVRFEKGASKAVDGYPLPLDDTQWPGLEVFNTRIVASLNHDDQHIAFFLSDGRFLLYHKTQKFIQQSPIAISDENWTGLAPFARSISAAYRWSESHSYFFLTDGRVLLYSHEKSSLEEEYPKPLGETIWKDIQPSWGQITHIFSWNSESMFLFFSSGVYARYNRVSYQIDAGYPKEIDDRRWPGMGSWLRKDKRLSLQPWKKESFFEGQKIALRLPYHMKEAECHAQTISNERFLTVSTTVDVSSEYASFASVLSVFPIAVKEPDQYERVILKTNAGSFLKTEKGSLLTTKNIDDAEVFFIDRNWGDYVVFFHHKKRTTWRNKEKIPAPTDLLPLFFFAQGEHVISKENDVVCGGSLLKIFAVE